MLQAKLGHISINVVRAGGYRRRPAFDDKSDLSRTTIHNPSDLSRITIQRRYIATLDSGVVERVSDEFGEDPKEIADTLGKRTLGLMVQEKWLSSLDECSRLARANDQTHRPDTGYSYGSTSGHWVLQMYQNLMYGTVGPVFGKKQGHTYLFGKSIVSDEAVLLDLINDPCAGFYLLLSFPTKARFMPPDLMKVWDPLSWDEVREELNKPEIQQQVDDYTGSLLENGKAPDPGDGLYLAFGGTDFVQTKFYQRFKKGKTTTVQFQVTTIDRWHNFKGTVIWVIRQNEDTPRQIDFHWYGAGDKDNALVDGLNIPSARSVFFWTADDLIDTMERWSAAARGKDFMSISNDRLTKMRFWRKALEMAQVIQPKWQEIKAAVWPFSQFLQRYWQKPSSEKEQRKPPKVGTKMIVEAVQTPDVIYLELTEEQYLNSLNNPDEVLELLQRDNLKNLYPEHPELGPGLFFEGHPASVDISAATLSQSRKVWTVTEAEAVANIIQQEMSAALTNDVLAKLQQQVLDICKKKYEDAGKLKKYVVSPLVGDTIDVELLPPDLYNIETLSTGLIDHGAIDDSFAEIEKLQVQMVSKLKDNDGLQQLAKNGGWSDLDVNYSLDAVISSVAMLSAVTGEAAYILASVARSAVEILFDMLTGPGPTLQYDQDTQLSESYRDTFKSQIRNARNRGEEEIDILPKEYMRDWWNRRLVDAKSAKEALRQSDSVKEEAMEKEGEIRALYLESLLSTITEQCKAGAIPERPDRQASKDPTQPTSTGGVSAPAPDQPSLKSEPTNNPVLTRTAAEHEASAHSPASDPPPSERPPADLPTAAEPQSSAAQVTHRDTGASADTQPKATFSEVSAAPAGKTSDTSKRTSASSSTDQLDVSTPASRPSSPSKLAWRR